MSSLILTMDPDHPANTTLYTPSGTILYTVTTRREAVSKTAPIRPFTDIRNEYNELLATLEWRDVVSDKMSIRDKGEVTMTSWVKKSFFSETYTFKDDTGRSYKWDKNGPKSQFQLFATDSKAEAKTPIATFARAFPATVNGPATKASLTLTPRAQEIQDTVVLTFLYLEKKRRVSETRSVDMTTVRMVEGQNAGAGILGS